MKVLKGGAKGKPLVLDMPEKELRVKIGARPPATAKATVPLSLEKQVAQLQVALSTATARGDVYQQRALRAEQDLRAAQAVIILLGDRLNLEGEKIPF